MLIYQSVITAILAAMLLNTIINLRLLRRPARRPPPQDGPLVSVLVPARNEARGIARCVESLARQDYPRLEILVLDDNSEDETAAIVAKLAEHYPSVRLLRGQPLPPHWHGKAYACAQLAQAAQGDWLLFVDADTVHAPECVSTTLQVALERKADLLTMIPQVLAYSFGEALLLPLVPLPFINAMPMGLVMGHKYPMLAGALGPFLLFRREPYWCIGGHEAVRTDIAEDMKFGRLVKQHGGRLAWIDGTGLVQIRFYQSFGEAWRGLAKSSFATINYSLPTLLAGMIACAIIFLTPYVFLVAGLLSQRFSAVLFWLPLSQIVLAWTARLLLAQRMHMSRAMVFLHGLTMLATILFTIHSTWQVIFGAGVTWKGRAYQFGPGQKTAGPHKRLARMLPALRLALACLLMLLGWRWKMAALGIAALLPLIIWTGGMLEHALTVAPDSASSVTLATAADGASGFASLSYLLLSGLMTPWLALCALLALLASARLFHWRSLPLAASVVLGSILLLIGGANVPLISIIFFWWMLGTLLLARRSIGQFLGAWFQRLRPPL